jgi:hypothetical protein
MLNLADGERVDGIGAGFIVYPLVLGTAQPSTSSVLATTEGLWSSKRV